MVENGFDPKKLQFWDSIRLPHSWHHYQIYQLHVSVDLHLQFNIVCPAKKEDLSTFVTTMSEI